MYEITLRQFAAQLRITPDALVGYCYKHKIDLPQPRYTTHRERVFNEREQAIIHRLRGN